MQTDGLPNFWQNSLVIIKEDEEYPHLIWGKYPSFSNISGYYIYSGTPSNGIAPNDNNYQQIQQTGSTVYDYVDNTVGGINEIGDAPYIRLYFVKAKQGTQYSERSNIEAVFSNVSWSNALVMVNEKNNPSLMWDEYKGFDAANISGYKIYRGMPSPIKPSLFIFSPIATVTKDEFKFIDQDILLSPTGDEVRYYVKAVLSQGESSATNTVSANGGLYENSPPKHNAANEFSLEQNYPNLRLRIS
jgi:hypothetical protein